MIPVNHKGNPGHWVVIGVFIRKKILVHLDSLHSKNERTFSVILCFLKNLFAINKEPFDFSEWLLVSPDDVPLQVDSINCGVYACINAMSLIHLRLYPVPPAHINQLRYYIVSKASKCLPSKPFGTRRKSSLQLEKPMFSSHNIESRFRFQNGTDTFESLHILVVGKKAGETESSDCREDAPGQSIGLEDVYESDSEKSLSDDLVTDHQLDGSSEHHCSQTGSLSAQFEKVERSMETFFNSDGSDLSSYEDDKDLKIETDEKTKESFLKSFEHNKAWIENLVKELRNKKINPRMPSERLIALTKLKTDDFRECAERELYIFQDLHETETFDCYRDDIMEMFKSKVQLDPSLPETKWLRDIRPNHGLRLYEFYRTVVLPELITNACQELEKLSYRQATLRMFAGSPYHIPLLKQVCCIESF